MAFEKGKIGNPEGRNAKPWKAAILRALARAEADGRDQSLNMLAERLLQVAMGGDMVALKELGDRVDGKVTTVIESTVRTGPLLSLEQAAEMAEAVIEESRIRAAVGASQPDSVHDSEPAGL